MTRPDAQCSLCFCAWIFSPGTYFYYKWRNAQKEKVWSKMSIDERSVYLATTTDEGCKRLDFRFAY